MVGVININLVAIPKVKLHIKSPPSSSRLLFANNLENTAKQCQLMRTKVKFELDENQKYFLHLGRALASQAVVVGHAASFFNVLPLTRPPHFFYIQNLGVIFFFFLSGFIITYSCHIKTSTGRYSFEEFIFDRLFRLQIVVIPVLFFIFITDYFFLNIIGISGEYAKNINIQSFFGNILFLQDYPKEILHRIFGVHLFSAPMFGTGRPLWTLAIEFWIYVFFGYIVLNKNKRITLFSLSSILFAISVPVVLYNANFGRGSGLSFIWFYGALAMLYFKSREEYSKTHPALILGLIVCLIFSAYDIAHGNFTGYSFQTNVIFGTILLLLITLFSNVKINLWNRETKRIIDFSASYSFTLYLTHYTILDWLYRIYSVKQEKPLLFFFSGIIISNIISIFIAYYTEMKYKSIRDAFKNKIIAATPVLRSKI